MKTLILSDRCVVGSEHDSCDSKLRRVDFLHCIKVAEKDRVIVSPLSFDVRGKFFEGFTFLFNELLSLVKLRWRLPIIWL